MIELAKVHVLKARKGGVNFGLIDYFIALEALKFKLSLFSRDKLILELARNLGVRKLAD
ncbi:MAG TPA: hypothetical protein PKA63_00010 [Oligoflexia bacterium]|nr:hypothetical protein [Oligoflexia bacterium]HMP47031.1 hypothetical protein [Oligoflexia bacterium]